MPFVTLPGLKGKVYVPQQPDGCVQKHPCRDCFSCQNCSGDRCRICLSRQNCRRSPLDKKKAEKNDAAG